MHKVRCFCPLPVDTPGRDVVLWSNMQTLRKALAMPLLPLLSLLLFGRASTGDVQAQATTATASRAADLQLGGGFSYGKHDYAFTPLEDGTRISGLSLYGTLDFKTHYGVEIAFHQLGTHKADNMYERTYEIGPRYVLHFNRINPYIRVMYGRGVFNYPGDVANLAYNIGALGGGVDLNAQKHVNVRVDYEYQRWYGFPLYNLQPQMVTVGAAYHF